MREVKQMPIPAEALEVSRGHEALRNGVRAAIEKLAIDPSTPLESFSAEVRGALEGKTPRELREIVGSQAAIQIKMHRGGGPGGTY